MAILVTGGTGYLGKRVVRKLIEEGEEPVLLVRRSSNLSGIPQKVKKVFGDVTDYRSISEAIKGCDRVLHMAALVKIWVRPKSFYDQVNVEGFKNIIRAAKEVGVSRFIYTSSFIALGPTDGRVIDEEDSVERTRFYTDYERTKYLAHKVAKKEAKEGFPIIILYPGVIYGPGELTEGNLVAGIILDFTKGKLLGKLGKGDKKWCYSFIDDVVSGHLSAIRRGKPGERYILGGENKSADEFFALLSQLSGIAPPERSIPYSLAKVFGYFEQFKALFFGKKPSLTADVVKTYMHDWTYSSEKAMRDLSYSITPLKEGLTLTLDWLKEKGYA
jgi:farnesol dehydrogenase